MCNYYELSNMPGTNQSVKVREGKFSFLDDEKIQAALISFKDETQIHVTFYLPQIHCSSCLWLLENLHRLEADVITSKVNFTRREVDIVFNYKKISLRKVAELLTSVGYEPYISLQQMKQAKPATDKSKIYKLGVAGFCFANIMLMSFPDYFGIDAKEQNLQQIFRYLNLILALPVFFYSASEFYVSAWKSLRHGFLNIDAPIVLSVLVTFCRSVYEVITGAGVGYFDSMSGIVFFMLVGRVLQDKTYEQLSFDRDYTAYFPVAVTRVNDEQQKDVTLSDIQLDDTLLIHHGELIPADGILTRGKALIDYSFVTGESVPVEKEMGEIVYAGGRQLGANIEMLVIKEVAQSYLTKLWNREELQKEKEYTQRSFVHLLSRYFTWIVFAIAAITAAYWWMHDSSKIWPAATAVLIVVCPCALLLSNTFTNGNILRILGRNQLYLRNAQTIEDIAAVDYIIFDKTGTLTTGDYREVAYNGSPLDENMIRKVTALAAQSTHPMSKAIAQLSEEANRKPVMAYKELPGKGIEGMIDGDLIMLGSRSFVTNSKENHHEPATVYLSIEGVIKGCFTFRNHYRDSIEHMIGRLKKKYRHLAVLSGDGAAERQRLQQMLGSNATILFNQQPEDKLEVIKQLQQQGHTVMMIGDGLNDAGALKQADVGVAVAEGNNSFTPASDAIVNASQLPVLHKLIHLCRFNKRIVLTAFIVSIVYNIVGVSFAVQGNLSPLIAAILMPCSSISIMLLTFGMSNIMSKKLKLF